MDELSWKHIGLILFIGFIFGIAVTVLVLPGRVDLYEESKADYLGYKTYCINQGYSGGVVLELGITGIEGMNELYRNFFTVYHCQEELKCMNP